MNVFDMMRPHGSKPSIDLVDIDQSAVTPLASKPMVMQVLSSNFSTVAGCLSKERNHISKSTVGFFDWRDESYPAIRTRRSADVDFPKFPSRVISPADSRRGSAAGKQCVNMIV